jgi:POT family proton-dependent oligopeptide transporter
LNPPETTPDASAGPERRPHPRGLATLFFTEMWERFSYYGLRGLLVLFMTGLVQKGGLGLDDTTAASIYGLYAAAVYLASLPGGWVADRLIGAQRAVWYGGIIIAAGHFAMALPNMRTFFLGLALVVAGTGLLKPNISAIVGGLYPEGGARRDAGFSIFYMGINLGAFFGPFICGTLGEDYNWHYGFGAAGVGMVLGLIQFRVTRGRLGEAGLRPGSSKPPGKATLAAFVGGLAVLVLVVGLCLGGAIQISPAVLAQYAQKAIITIAGLYFAGVFFFGRLDAVERRRVAVILVLFVSAALFWAGFEQAGSFFNLFAERHTIRSIGWLASLTGRSDVVVPASWFQSLDPVFVISLAPVMAWVWIRLGRKNLDPATPVKFGLGLLLLALGFAVMAWASMYVAAGEKVRPTWLITIYLIHTLGELCLSPVGLSSVTKLAPRRFLGQMMGMWFVAASLGNLLAGKLAGQFDENALARWPALCLPMILLPVGLGLALIIFSKPVKNLMSGAN